MFTHSKFFIIIQNFSINLVNFSLITAKIFRNLLIYSNYFDKKILLNILMRFFEISINFRLIKIFLIKKRPKFFKNSKIVSIKIFSIKIQEKIY